MDGRWRLTAPKSTVFTLVKILEEREWAEQFSRGELYMNSLAFFRDYRDKSGVLRGDEYEGVGAIYQPDKLGELVLAGRSVDLKEVVAPIRMAPHSLAEARVFCSYSCNSRGFDFVSAENLASFKKILLIHQDCYAFGNVAAVVLNVTEFQKRVLNAIKALSAKAACGLVNYFDEATHHGSLMDKPGFYKRKAFDYQREHRVLVYPLEPIDGPLRLSVGDLSDIVHITTPDEFNRLLSIKLPDGSVA